MDRHLLVSFTVLVLLASHVVPVHSWSNGGDSADPNNPDYGTHDWLAHHALDFVPDNMDFWIRDNLAVYLYGTELPDNAKAVLGDGIGDKSLHHVYYRSDGRLQDNASARRARESCDRVISYLATRDYGNAAKWMGVTSHYIADLAVFGHVMGSSTDWGSEKHHDDYEDWVNVRTNRYDSAFVTYLRFDGRLDAITAYDVALRLAMDTTFDSTGKERTAKWMDDNYAPANPSYQERIGESLSLAVNLLVDVIYSIFDFSLSSSGGITVTQGGSGSNTITVTLISGTIQTVSLTVSGLLTDATASFNPPSGNPTFTSTCTISTSMSTPTGSYTITVTGTGGGLTRTTTFTLAVNPPFGQTITTIARAVDCTL